MKRFTVTRNDAPGAHFDRIGRYGVKDAHAPQMGSFYSGMTEAQAKQVARELNAR